MTETWWERNLRLAREWDKAIYGCWIGEMAIGVYVDTTHVICGYDPQKLLPDHRSYEKRLIDEIYGTFGQSYAAMSAHYENLFPRDIGHEYIDFGPAELGSLAHQLAGEMTAVVAAGREISLMRHREPTFRTETIVIPADLTAFLEEGRDKLWARIMESIDVVGVKNRQMGLYALGASLALKEIKPVAVKQSRRYLKHDPTKNHRRRRRK